MAIVVAGLNSNLRTTPLSPLAVKELVWYGVCLSASAEANIGVRFLTYGMVRLTALSVNGVEDVPAKIGVSSGVGKVSTTLLSAKGVSYVGSGLLLGVRVCMRCSNGDCEDVFTLERLIVSKVSSAGVVTVGIVFAKGFNAGEAKVSFLSTTSGISWTENSETCTVVWLLVVAPEEDSVL